jgi:hypothetical protein
VEGIIPPSTQLLPPHIILQSNLDLFLDILEIPANAKQTRADLPAEKIKRRNG